MFCILTHCFLLVNCCISATVSGRPGFTGSSPEKKQRISSAPCPRGRQDAGAQGAGAQDAGAQGARAQDAGAQDAGAQGLVSFTFLISSSE